ncbi:MULTISPECIES: AGE family epimerase/isomerase [Modicisalibacter]|uniref:AGE family epimerase/isomerase n=1 Tax=Modicisalibacter tunisiensis TaxID=390637 RepID=A0ABS7X0Y6_9GAMM|nr:MULTISPECIES: AGE family epimerase/isomerase [Modicisalibacter]MBZ9568546.1 AGE family epimerase/isomerase [Modicisalibacter tunisiensis]
MPLDDPRQLRSHLARTMAFYHPRCIDAGGGFHHYLKDDGEVYDARHRHLVSSARYVFTYARHAAFTGREEYRHWARHGLRYLEQAHFQTRYQGYAWTLIDHQPEDTTNHCYGLAFVLLAYATALRCGIEEAREGLERVHALQTRRFWEPEWQLYADEADTRWRVSDYRGQNANMHSCEALIAAFEATQDPAYLERALAVARAIWQRQARQTDGWIWEHFDRRWRVDLEYNRDDPHHLFRPWGFQIGHQTEWAKLLTILSRHCPDEAWLLPTAARLFIEAVEAGWDADHGGLVYGVDLERHHCDGDKYFWVQAESLAAAAMLADATGELRFWRWYRRLADFSWQWMIDHRHGGWYRILTPDNRRYSDEKSPAGKVDYHTMGACHDILPILERREAHLPRV